MNVSGMLLANCIKTQKAPTIRYKRTLRGFQSLQLSGLASRIVQVSKASG